MKCPLCEGTGKGLWVIDGVQDKCQMCNGNGTIKQTNEEWLKSASTEELAQFVLNVSEQCFFCGYKTHQNVEFTVPCKKYCRPQFMEWLKEKKK